MDSGLEIEIEIEIIERLKQKFSEYNINFEEFCKLLVENNAFLSGSFLLQVIQNKFFDDINSDIDIYTFGNKNKHLEKSIKYLIKNAIIKKMNNGNFKSEVSDDEKTTKSEKNDVYIDTYEFADDDSMDEGFLNNKAETNKIKKDEHNWNIYIEPLKQNIEIINKYKGIVRCQRLEFEARLYNYTKINEIVDFEIAQNLLCKYQLIYFDEEKYKRAFDIINNFDFDFDFCANYFDGKKIFIKNYSSIKSASCILNLTQPRIYNNQKNRILKYMLRGYEITARHNNNDYKIIYVDSQNNTIVDIEPNVTNLIIICKDAKTNINQIMAGLPVEIERIIIYTYPCKTKMDNLPSSLKELRLYIWIPYSGTQSLAGRIDPRTTESWELYNYFCEEHKSHIEEAISNIKKIPFSCEIYINDKVVSL